MVTVIVMIVMMMIVMMMIVIIMIIVMIMMIVTVRWALGIRGDSLVILVLLQEGVSLCFELQKHYENTTKHHHI